MFNDLFIFVLHAFLFKNYYYYFFFLIFIYILVMHQGITQKHGTVRQKFFKSSAKKLVK